MSEKEENKLSELTEWDWKNTELSDVKRTILNLNEIKQLLLTRGEKKRNLNKPKIDLANKLKQKYKITLNIPFNKLTSKQLLSELKLRGLNYKTAKKNILIERLNAAVPRIRKPKLNETPQEFAKQISWEHTEIKDLSLPYLQQLLLNRGVDEEIVPSNINEAIKLLKEKHCVKFQEPVEFLTCSAITAELKLYGKNHRGKGQKTWLIKDFKDTVKHHTYTREWIYLQKLNEQNVSTPIMINDNEFLIAGDKCIMKYDILNSKWNNFMNYKDDTIFWPRYHISCSNIKHNLMYIFECCNYGNETLFIVNWNTKNIKSIHCSMRIGQGCRMIFVHGQIHLIGGYHNKKHLIFDEKTEIFNVCHTFDDNIRLDNFSIINVCSKNKLLLIVNYKLIPMYEYDILTHKWLKLKLKIPMVINCCVVSKNDEYVIMMGGDTFLDIFIMDLKNMNVYKSDIKCATTITFKSQIIIIHSKNDKLKEELTVFGYVRNCFKLENISLNMFPPHYIIKIIKEYCTVEFIHMFNQGHTNYWSMRIKHRKIPINDIMRNMTLININ